MRVLVTGSAGFIGYHLSKHLLSQGLYVLGVDALTNYYDVNLKIKRNTNLLQNQKYCFKKANLVNNGVISPIIKEFSPDIIVHLAAQAGVRYSLEHPREYLNSNIIGSFNILELAKELKVKHLLMASTSSVYGANEEMPFEETVKADTQLTFYAATKKANESMAHSYSHLWGIPVTMFRFFTVYGPWGRPDMALFKFTRNILENREIDVYNNGKMYRDFTYVEDLANAIALLINKIPNQKDYSEVRAVSKDSLSPVAPYRVVNIGNSQKILLTDFIDVIERELGVVAKKNLMPMQMGDVPSTWANCELLKNLTGYSPETPVEEGVRKFVQWFRWYYDK